MNQQNLTIYDFIVDVIPGTVAILLAISVLPAEQIGNYGFNDLSLGSSILIIVIGYIVGHLIQAVASPIDHWVYFKRNEEYPFEAVLQKAKNREESSVEKRFTKNIEEFFEGCGENAADLNGYETFQLTQSYLWNHDIGRARRFQILYTFMRSTWVVLAIGTGAHIVTAITDHFGEYQLAWTPLQSVLIILGLAGCTIISFSRRIKYHNMMANSLVYDFYANVLSRENDE